MKITNKRLIQLCFISVLVGTISFVPICLHFDGQYMDYGDYFLQYIPFIKELKRMVLSGSLSWSWNSFLGDGFVGAYSYYTIFNPFAWFVMIFPNEYILYGTMVAILMKFAISSIGAFLYINLFCENSQATMIGALIYTFSGFTIVNTNFYFFLDVIAAFPFIFCGLERLIRENKTVMYVIAVFINALINYYFFVSSVMLTVIYIVFRLKLYRISSWKKLKVKLLRIILFSVIGTGLASIALIPSLYSILGSAKAMENIGRKPVLYYWPQNILERIKTFLVPIESGRYHAFFDCSTWSSTAIYLPVVGSYCFILRCFKKNDWLKKMCFLLVLCYFVPFLNAVFNLFSSVDYTRWLYGLVLLFSLGTALQLVEIERNVNSFDRRVLFVISTFTFLLLLVPSIIYLLQLKGISLINRFCSVTETDMFMGYFSIIVIFLLTIMNYGLLWMYIKSHNRCLNKMLWCVVSMCIANFFVYNALNYDLHATEYRNRDYYLKSMVEGKELNTNRYKFRIDTPEQIANYGLFKNIPSVNYYNSLQNINSSKFAKEVGIGDNLQDTILAIPDNGGGNI